MFQLQWWWMLVIIILPILVRWLFKADATNNQLALKVPFLNDFQQKGEIFSLNSTARLIMVLASVAWIALVFATARPVWVGEPIEEAISGRDLMLAVDLSGSMQERDFELKGRLVDRLSATKFVAGDFIQRRKGDRIGLILFGDQAYLQAPLTFDHKTVRILLNEAMLGLAGERTAIGDAIGLALKRLTKQQDKNHVLILMTDGANTAGAVSPLEATEKAAQAGLKIYTVGIGSERGRKTLFGLPFNVGGTDIDEMLLTKIAKQTGGQYFRARNTQEFMKIYDKLDQLETIDKDIDHWRPRKDLFQWPLGFSLFLTLIIIIIRLFNKNTYSHVH